MNPSLNDHSDMLMYTFVVGCLLITGSEELEEESYKDGLHLLVRICRVQSMHSKFISYREFEDTRPGHGVCTIVTGTVITCS